MPRITTSSFVAFKLNLLLKFVVIEYCLSLGNAKRLFKIIDNLTRNKFVLRPKAYKREGAFGAGG